MNEVFDARTCALEWSALPIDQCPAEPVVTGVGTLPTDTFVTVGVWEHPAGESTDVEQDEVFVVLSGSGRVELDDGRVLALAPGTVGILAAGTRTTWHIDEPLRKVWIAAR